MSNAKATYKQKKDQQFVLQWKKKRTNRWRFALRDSIVFTLFFTVLFHLLGDDLYNIVKFLLVFLVALVVNFLFSFFLTFPMSEARFQKLQKLDSQDN
jgi:hypothetical protein